MIKAVFYKKNGLFVGFDVSGHAGFSDSGSDVVCAAVSSAVMLSANLITDGFGTESKASAMDNKVSLWCGENDKCDVVIGSLAEHLEQISLEYEGTISIIIKEEKNHA
ncbi:MAG: ribosomal-processing cysteine protease Prp [Oscillospiraceae bacterium]|nr:ribosomal-processing cysteine protease Prp [Oscillospiraceae bacterium]